MCDIARHPIQRHYQRIEVPIHCLVSEELPDRAAATPDVLEQLGGFLDPLGGDGANFGDGAGFGTCLDVAPFGNRRALAGGGDAALGTGRRDPAGGSRVAGESPSFQAPAFPLPAVLFLLLVALLLLMLAVDAPRQAALGVAVVALGWPVHRVMRRTAGRVEARAG